MMEPYGLLLGTSIDDLLQVDALDDYYPPPLYTSKRRFANSAPDDQIPCAWCAGIPTRQESPDIAKSRLVPVLGGEVYFDMPSRKNPGKIILFVDDSLARDSASYGDWPTVYYLQKAFALDTVLGGDPDVILDLFNQLTENSIQVSLLVCDHNLGWKSAKDANLYFRYGTDFVSELERRMYQVPPIILHSDIYFHPASWDAIKEYVCFVPKYESVSDEDYRKTLSDTIRDILS